MVTRIVPIGLDNDATYKCDNCDRQLQRSELDPIQRLEVRVEVGGEMPAGECPYCGCLAYLVRPQKENIRVTVEGGVVQCVDRIPAGMTVEVWDFDIEEVGDEQRAAMPENDEGDKYDLIVWGSS